MINHDLNRRDALGVAAGASLTALFPRYSNAQERANVVFSNVPARSAGSIHVDRMRQAREALRGSSPLSVDGLLALIDYLERNQVIPREEANILRDLILLIFGRETIPLPELLDRVTEFLKNLKSGISDVVVAIVDIARGSIEYARTVLEGIPYETVIRVIANDISGALTGAGTGFTLGGQTGAVIGAIIGSSSTSAIAAFQIRA